MKKLAVLLTAAVLIPSLAAAQQKPVFEIGTYMGISAEKYSGETMTSIDVPQLGIYTSFFPSANVFVQPELAFSNISNDGDSYTALALMASPGWAFGGFTTHSFYAAPSGGLLLTDFSDEEAEVDYAAGAKAGYRALIRDALAIRFEVAYYRQFPEVGEETDLFMFRIGIGGILNSAAPRTAAR